MLIDHDNNENSKFPAFNRMKNSEAVRNPKWIVFHIVFVTAMILANIHFEWGVDARAVFFMAALGSLYLAGMLIAVRGAVLRMLRARTR